MPGERISKGLASLGTPASSGWPGHLEFSLESGQYLSDLFRSGGVCSFAKFTASEHEREVNSRIHSQALERLLPPRRQNLSAKLNE